MKIYHTATQKAYDELMLDLEEKGYKWFSGHKPTAFNYWEQNKESSCIKISGKIIVYRDIEFCKNEYPCTPIIEYKDKKQGEKQMTNEEMKQKISGFATYVSIAAGSLARDIKFESKESTVEFDLKEAKSSAKKLIEHIDEYLEYLKPKFKVGDYVTDTSGNNPYICKIEEFEGHGLVGNWYCFKDNHLDKSIVLPISTSRLSTPEEISEYKTALNFYKHDRDPFEVKYGDILVGSGCAEFFVDYDDIDILETEDFISGRYTLLKTVEEFKKWAGADDE